MFTPREDPRMGGNFDTQSLLESWSEGEFYGSCSDCMILLPRWPGIGDCTRANDLCVGPALVSFLVNSHSCLSNQSTYAGAGMLM